MSNDKHPLSRVFPEVRRFHSRDEANKVLGRGEKRLWTRPKYWIAAIGGCVPGMIVWNTSVLSFWHLDSILGPMATIAGPFVGIFLICGPEWRRYLRQELNARGIPICMKCGYDLTGNESGTCPECGEKVEPG